MATDITFICLLKRSWCHKGIFDGGGKVGFVDEFRELFDNFVEGMLKLSKRVGGDSCKFLYCNDKRQRDMWHGV